MRMRRAAAGFALIESMVTIVVIAFGLLGVAGLVSRSFVTEAEANQRTQAQLLLQDMVSRIEANRGNAATYVTGDNGITGYVDVNGNPTLLSCDPASVLVERDRCEWGQMIAGDRCAQRLDADRRHRLHLRAGRLQPRLRDLDRLAGSERDQRAGRRSGLSAVGLR